MPPKPWRWFFLYVCAEFVITLFVGGGSRPSLGSDAIVEIAALPTLVWLVGVGVDANGRPRRVLTPAAIGLVALFGLALVELIRMPPDIWTHARGRQAVVEGFQHAGLPLPWLPLGLNAPGAFQAILTLLPALAIFYATPLLSAHQLRVLCRLLLGFAMVSVTVGLAQTAQKGAATLYFQLPADVGLAVGFFSNRNHFAACLAACVPVLAALTIERMGRPNRSAVWVVTPLVILAALTIGVAITQSRAGVLLFFVSIVGSGAIVYLSPNQTRRHRTLRKPLLAAVVLGALLILFEVGFVGFSDRFAGQSVASDLRWDFLPVGARIALAYFPFGVGLGGFVDVYKMFETPASVMVPFVNHVHNDWLEIAIELGLLGLAAEIVFLGVFVFWFVRIWRRQTHDPFRTNIARAGSVVALVLCLHSLVDYPLRALALMTIFAFALGLMRQSQRAPREAERSSEPSHRRVRSVRRV